jgi:hypothetical protein
MAVPSILQGESRTRLLQGIALGVIATLVVGFSWGGWVTGGAARSMTATAAVAKLKLMQYGHDDVVREFVNKVVDTEMDYSFARACASGIDDALTKTAAKG